MRLPGKFSPALDVLWPLEMRATGSWVYGLGLVQTVEGGCIRVPRSGNTAGSHTTKESGWISDGRSCEISTYSRTLRSLGSHKQAPMAATLESQFAGCVAVHLGHSETISVMTWEVRNWDMGAYSMDGICTGASTRTNGGGAWARRR